MIEINYHSEGQRTVVMVIDRLHFSSFCDFYERRKLIKALYERMASYDKKEYKYYVYSRRYLREKTCDMIWEFLNARDELEYAQSVMELGRERIRYKYE